MPMCERIQNMSTYACESEGAYKICLSRTAEKYAHLEMPGDEHKLAFLFPWDVPKIDFYDNQSLHVIASLS